MSTANPSSATTTFGQPYYPPTPPKDIPHDSLLDQSNKQHDLLNNKNYHTHNGSHQNIFPNTTSPTTSAAAAAAAYHHHNWGHVLKDSAAFWSTMKSPTDSSGKLSNSNSKKKPSQGL